MSSKRRKILTADSSPKDGSDSGIIRLFDLPVEPRLTWPAMPSRALFDVALNFDAKPSADSSGSSAIAGNDWDALDFGDMEKDLAAKLTDDDTNLTNLNLYGNKIDDNGVGILVDALQNNKSLTTLNLLENDGISTEGQINLLKLVNDISSIKATLQSNHTLKNVYVDRITPSVLESGEEIRPHIFLATMINEGHVSDQEAAGREKCIQTQLNSETKAQLCRLQGVDHSVFSDIDPLHLPEVLSLIGERHDCEELYLALKASIMTLFSTMNREKCIQQKMEYHAAKSAEYEAMAAGHRTKLEELDKELATFKEEAAVRSQDNVHSQSNKRRRTCVMSWGYSYRSQCNAVLNMPASS
eukprot:scaffold274_cov78-Skeletonema_dohrnii-CCMP3373.AAC.2